MEVGNLDVFSAMPKDYSLLVFCGRGLLFLVFVAEVFWTS